jgi:hypothetical protein
MCRARGRSLHVDALVVPPGKHWLRVEQDRTTDVPSELAPVYENVSDDYSLRVAVAAHRPGVEIEPNDVQHDAQTMHVGDAIEARVGWKADVDVFCAAPGSPSARFVVTDRRTQPGAGVSSLSTRSFPAGATTSLPKDDAVGGGPGAQGGSATGSECIAVSLSPPAASACTHAADDDDAPYRVSLETR